MIEEAWPNPGRIGVVSDTHLPRGGRPYPDALLRGLEGVDLILHAGDAVVLEALEPLQAIAPVVAVHGNMDTYPVAAVLPAGRLVRVGSFLLGLVHGHRGPGRSTPERARNTFGEVDAVVFGHTHAPLCEESDGVLLFNPGSPTDRRHQPRFSFGILHVEERLRGEILTFD